MPRKWFETVEQFPPLQQDRWYHVRVSAIEKDRTRNAIAVDLEHLDPDQQGRATSIQLDLPVRPAGLTAGFFSCWRTLEVGKAIAPKDMIGLILQARFAISPDGAGKPTHFRPDPKADDARETALPAGGPGKQNDAAYSTVVSQQETQVRQRAPRKVGPAQPANFGTMSVETQEDLKQRKNPDHG